MEPTCDKKAVVLSSGGLDSTTVLAIAASEGRAIYGLSFDYGQRHRFELESANLVARALGVAEHKLVRMDLRQFGGSALTDDIPVPKGRDPAEIGGDIPITYVPARNTIFLSYALAWSEVVGAGEIWLGVNALDYSGYPDCRPEYIAAFEKMARLATRAGVRDDVALSIRAPLIDLPKADIIRRGLELGVDYGLTHSCYDPNAAGLACGRCDACRIRLAAFAEVGVEDPIAYVA